MSDKRVAPIKRTFPASQFAAPSDAPVGEYFPDAETLRIRQKARIWARVSAAIYSGPRREAEALKRAFAVQSERKDKA